MRLSFVSTILFSLIATMPCTIIEAAQTWNVPTSADQTETSSTLPIDVKATTVASPLSGWQTKIEGNPALVAAAIEHKNTKSVIIEFRKIAVDLDCEVPLKSFFKRGSFEVHTGSMPFVDANSDVGESRLSSADFPVDSTANAAAAVESVRRAMPVMLAKVNDDGVLKMMKALSLGNGSVTENPTVVCYSGQTATLSDMSVRPFVVGVKPIAGDVAVAHQPIIQTIEDGLMFRFHPVINEGKIDLSTNLAHSKVSDVKTFTVSGTKEGGITVQIPEQTLKHVNVSTTLKDGETLFLDPRLQIEVAETQASKIPFKKSKKVATKKQVYFMITARIVAQKDMVSHNVSQSK